MLPWHESLTPLVMIVIYHICTIEYAKYKQTCGQYKLNYYWPQLWPRLCFYMCLWFCSQGGGGLQAGRTPRDREIPPDQADTPPDQGEPPWDRETPQDQADPPGRENPPDQADPTPDQGDPPRPGRPPEPGRHPPDQGEPLQDRETPPGPGRLPWQGEPTRTRQTPPRPGRTSRTRQTPPGKQTPEYGLRAAGTHPTGMHSYLKYLNILLSSQRPGQTFLKPSICLMPNFLKGKKWGNCYYSQRWKTSITEPQQEKQKFMSFLFSFH